MCLCTMKHTKNKKYYHFTSIFLPSFFPFFIFLNFYDLVMFWAEGSVALMLQINVLLIYISQICIWNWGASCYVSIFWISSATSANSICLLRTDKKDCIKNVLTILISSSGVCVYVHIIWFFIMMARPRPCCCCNQLFLFRT